MNDEQLYKDALERARICLNDSSVKDIGKRHIEYIFPELKESEDERIRKAITHILYENYTDAAVIEGVEIAEIVAWLEKQGEQRSAKVEVETLIPQKGKYYVCIKNYHSADGKTTNTKGRIYKSSCDGYINDDKGFGLSWTNSCTENIFRPISEEDWIVCEQDNVIGKPIQYKELKNKVYQESIKTLEDNGFVPNLRLWTIADAKDGDVLVTTHDNGRGQIIFIFKRIVDDSMYCYCLYDSEMSDKLCFDPCIDSDFIGGVSGAEEEFCPATKEQRDLLFQKMKEAGYEWDDDKKELKKIEPVDELTEFEDAIKDMMNAYRDAIDGNDVTIEEVKKHSAYLMSLIPQNPTEWSNEDEAKLKSVLFHIEDVENKDVIDWLKSLKNRIRPGQPWNSYP